jgi:hypothetical protein
MPSSGMLCCVTCVRTDVSEGHIASVMRVARIGKLGKMITATRNHSVLRLLVTANVFPSLQILVTLMIEAISNTFLQKSVLTGATESSNYPSEFKTVV